MQLLSTCIHVQGNYNQEVDVEYTFIDWFPIILIFKIFLQHQGCVSSVDCLSYKHVISMITIYWYKYYKYCLQQHLKSHVAIYNLFVIDCNGVGIRYIRRGWVGLVGLVYFRGTLFRLFVCLFFLTKYLFTLLCLVLFVVCSF